MKGSVKECQWWYMREILSQEEKGTEDYGYENYV
jgi:hypothetical protein